MKWPGAAQTARAVATSSKRGDMPSVPCQTCGEEFHRPKATRTIYCTDECATAARRAKRKRPDQDLTCRACGTAWTRPATKGQAPRRCPDCLAKNYERVDCEWCGSSGPGRRDGKYCSLICYGQASSARANPSCDLLHQYSCTLRDHLPRERPHKRRKHLRPSFVEGPCAWCGERFIVRWQTTARYCSKMCAKYAERKRYGRRFIIRPTERQIIYERDRYVCQLCGDPADPTAPPSSEWALTLDHIIPRSMALRKGFPIDEVDHPTNLRTAHRWCNSLLNDGRHGYTIEDLAPDWLLEQHRQKARRYVEARIAG